jgi:PAS domain S-box-containing protein
MMSPSANASSSDPAASSASPDPREHPREEIIRRDAAQGVQRENVLDRHDLPASNAGEAFQRIARLTADVMDAPIALVTFLGKDWQWFNATVGTDLDGNDVDKSFCIYTVQRDGPLIVEDATEDPRFSDLPIVEGPPHLRFYAGYPLTATDGTRVGTLCVFDLEAKSPSEDDVEHLEDLALLATNEIALRRSLIERRSTEQRLQGILETSVAAILVLSADGELVYTNDRARDLFASIAGPDAEHIVSGTQIHDLDLDIQTVDGTPLSPEDMTLQHVVETGEPVRGERRALVWSEDHRLMIELNAAPLTNRHGDVEEVVYSIEDVSEEYYNEQLRTHQQEVLEQVAYGAELSDALTSIVDMMETLRPGLRGSVMLLDNERLFEGAAPSIADELMPPDDGAMISADRGACARAAYHDEEVVVEDIATDPQWAGSAREAALRNGLRSCWSIPIRGDEGTVLGTLALWWPSPHTPDDRDEHLGRTAVRLAGIAIERAHSEQELRESEAHFQQLAENIDEVFWLRTRGDMLYVSPAYEHIWGRAYAGIDGTVDGHLGLVHPTDLDRVRDAYRRSWESGERFDEEYRIVRPDGSVRWIHSVAWTFTIEGSPEHRQAGYAVDVTDQIQRRHELLAAKQEAEELNRLKTAFLANMSHEIRTPLTSIIGFAEILEDELGDEHGRAPELIHTAGRRLMNTLDSVLQLSRLEADAIRLNPVETPLCKEVRETFSLFKTQAEDDGIDLRLDTPDHPVHIRTDPSALQRILQNLIGNAIKFTTDGYVRVGVEEREDTVQVEVEDSGVGISRDFQGKVFEAFEQESTGPGRSYEGSGLGLTVVKRLVTLMGGQVGMQSTRGEGTTFIVTLPTDGPASPLDSTSAKNGVRPLGSYEDVTPADSNGQARSETPVG